MTTEAFLAALKRFIAQRGLPSHIHSDNAKTFKGAQNKLHELYKLQNSSVNFETASLPIEAYNSISYLNTYSPNHAIQWETAVKSAKFHMKRVVSTKTYTYEQLATIFAEIESVLNSRPQTPLSQDPLNFSCLTPGHFLIGGALTSFLCPDVTEVPINRL